MSRARHRIRIVGTCGRARRAGAIDCMFPFAITGNPGLRADVTASGCLGGNPVKRARIFLAGGSGVIGRFLVPMLLDQGLSVVASSRSAAGARTIAALGATPRVLDGFDRPAVMAALCDVRPDVVIHQMTSLPDGLDPARMPAALTENARLREVATGNLVAGTEASGASRLIAQSIAFAYAPGCQPHQEDDPLDPAQRGVIRLEEQVATCMAADLILRYGRLYGPGTGADLPRGPCPLHVAEAARAACLAVFFGNPGTYNIAENDGTVSVQRAERELGFCARSADQVAALPQAGRRC